MLETLEDGETVGGVLLTTRIVYFYVIAWLVKPLPIKTSNF